jgi:hypothetical protein
MSASIERASARQLSGTLAGDAPGNALVEPRVNFQKPLPANGVISYPPAAAECNYNLVEWVRHSQSQKVVWLVINSLDGRFVYGYKLCSKHPQTGAKCYMCGQSIMVFDGHQWNCPCCHVFYVPLYPPPYMPRRLQDEHQEKPKRPCRMCATNEVAGNRLFCANCRKHRRRASNREAVRRSRRKQSACVNPSAPTSQIP